MKISEKIIEAANEQSRRAHDFEPYPRITRTIIETAEPLLRAEWEKEQLEAMRSDETRKMIARRIKDSESRFDTMGEFDTQVLAEMIIRDLATPRWVETL